MNFVCVWVWKALRFLNNVHHSELYWLRGVFLTAAHRSLPGGEAAMLFKIEISKVTTPDSAAASAAAAEHFPPSFPFSVTHSYTDEVPLRKWDQAKEETKRKKKKVLVCCALWKSGVNTENIRQAGWEGQSDHPVRASAELHVAVLLD